MSREPKFYICPVCFNTSTTPDECHVTMVLSNAGDIGDEQRKPIKNRFGQFHSRAPRWFVEIANKVDPDTFKKDKDQT